MAKAKLKTEVKRLKKRLKELRKVVKVGVKAIDERDRKIAQLSSVVEMDQKRAEKREAA